MKIKVFRRFRVIKTLVRKAIKILLFLCSFTLLVFICHKAYNHFSIEKSSDIGMRIDKYARRFLGTPYDKIKIGAYVANKTIIYDREVDCMYLVFRVLELALADGDDGRAVQIALKNRFRTYGKLDKNSKVINYDERYEYSEDVIASGKFGKSIFTDNEMQKTDGDRMYKHWYQLPIKDVINNEKIFNKENNQNGKEERILDRIKTGDIIFFIRKKEIRVVNEIVAHLGIVERMKNGDVYVIHASGKKDPNNIDEGVVRVKLGEYLKNKLDKFSGIYITRIA